MKPERLLDWSFRILLAIVPFLFYSGNFELFEFNKMMAVYGLTIAVATVWVWRMVATNKVIFKRSVLDVPLLIFLASQVVSTIFSVDMHVSLWGYYSRFNGGLISIVCYLVLYWAYVANVNDWETVKRHLKFLMGAGAVVSLYAVWEHFGVSPSCVFIYHQFNDSCWIQNVRDRVFATLGQPNWLSAWVAAIAPVTWAMIVTTLKIREEKKRRNLTVFWAGVAGLFFLTTIYTKSRSGFLAFGVAEMVFWAILAMDLWRRNGLEGIKNLVKPLVVVNIVYAILVVSSGTPWTPSLEELTIGRHKGVVKAPSTVTALESGGTETGEIRKIVWKGALDMGLAHPLFGTGVETFGETYYQFRPKAHNNTSEWDFLYNKAHNEFLNYFATTGLFGLGAYLTVIGIFIVWTGREIWKKSRTDDSQSEMLATTVALTAGWVTILATNFFGFSVVAVQIEFFLFPAMVVVAMGADGRTHGEKESHRTLSGGQVIGIGAVVVAGTILLWQVVRMWRGDIFFAEASKLYGAGNSVAGFTEVRQALELNGDEPIYKDLLAQISASLVGEYAREKQATLTAQLEDVAISESDAATATSPDDLQLWDSRTRIFYTLAGADKTNENEFMTAALTAITRATMLAPTYPKPFYNLGLTELQLGQVSEAKKSLGKAIALKPDYKEPRYALALVLAGEKNYQEAIKEGEYILAKIDSQDVTVKELVASWSAEITK